MGAAMTPEVPRVVNEDHCQSQKFSVLSFKVCYNVVITACAARLQENVLVKRQSSFKNLSESHTRRSSRLRKCQ